MKLINYKLWKEKKALHPSREFKSALWKKLDNAWQKEYQTKVFWYQMPAFRYSMAVLAVLVFISTTGIGAYAYNSPEVTEGTRLYGIKKAIEKVEEKVAERRAPESQAKFYLKQIERREAEKQVVERRMAHEVQLQKTEEKIDRTEKQLEKVSQALMNASTTIKDTKVIGQVQKRLEVHKVKLETKIETGTEKLQKIQENLIFNSQLYEESNPSISGDGSNVGNDNAGASSSTTEKSKAGGKSIWGRVKQHILNIGTSSGQVRTSTSDNSR